jgi:hypothetical protein
MFRCDHCHTEYGGIRGIDSGACPRCTSQSEPDRERRFAVPAWRAPQLELAAPRWSALASPLLGPIAELDRAARL